MLIFHSMAVHKGVSNASDRLRMSIDARYQRISEPIAPGSLLPHAQPATWEEIYADSDWDRDDLKHYWQKWDMEVKEYDNSYHEKRDRDGIGDGRKRGPRRDLSSATDCRP